MPQDETNRTEAQRRADRIRAFRQEFEQLERDGVLALPDDVRDRVQDHHSQVLEELQGEFDVDTTDSERRVSWGMRIASTIGAMALAIAVYFFFYRFWGGLSTAVQVLVLIAGPCLAVAAMHWVSRLEKTLYFTGLIGAVGFSCFVLNLGVLGTIFNITPTPRALVPWGAFALILAYAYGLRLMLALGILSIGGYVTATTGSFVGAHWMHVGERPEYFLLAGLTAFAVPFVARHRRRETFPAVYRFLGMLVTFITTLVLANWGRGSVLPLDHDAVEVLYQTIGFLVAGLAIWFGIRMGMREVVNVGATFFVIFLYTKFFDWWWDWMPKYLFFLVMGLIAIGLLFVLSRARAVLRRATR